MLLSLGLTSWYVEYHSTVWVGQLQVLPEISFSVLNRTYVRTNYIGVVHIVDENATIQKKL